ncbi:hypothetical protein PFISCL1PPCAC_7478 [Pristionchus fissidentatus]|uniref:MHD domain-containing protein n=1 Tax=Pristionchus fissidentatus TaxID=1538716 RepID=A0AAV5VA22_9BILA|nr:hypothetical protein PFISCL1PPCAC_7478 [Pristionchus fissidentatus]
MTGLKYRDQFWGEKHFGYHTLYERFKAGDEAVYEMEMLIKEHVTMQEDQLRVLVKTLGKVTNFASSCTTQMVEAWSLTKGTLELLQEIQTASLRGLQEQSRELAKYRADLAHSKKRVKESECVEAVGLMQTTTTCLQKAKETYAARCAELDKLRVDTSASAKEINKSEHKLSRARDEYRAYVDKYEMVRMDFEDRMEKSADAFEAHDRSHLTTLKNHFLAFAACQQEQSAAMLQVHSQFRESLGSMSVEGMMDKFCSECSTGIERPHQMQFESLESSAPSTAFAPSFSQLALQLQQGGGGDAASTAGGGGVHSDSQSVESGQTGSHGGGGGSMQQQPAQMVDLLTMDDPLPAPLKEEEEEQREKEMEEGESGGRAGGGAGTVDRKDEKETPLSNSMSASFSASLGGSRQKLSMWLPGKRKKTSSVCSTDVAAVDPAAAAAEGVASSSGGGGFLNKFGRSRRSNKSKTDIPNAVAGEGGNMIGIDDTYSTASSSRSEDKSSCLLTHSLEPMQPTVDEEGFTIRGKEDEEESQHEEAKWASCSSDEDDEDACNSLQQSRIRSLTIRPADAAAPKLNASVDELRDAIGSINIARSSTFDKDPWSGGVAGRGGSAAPFSQSLGPGAFSLRTPLRAATTGGDEHRAQFSESDFSRSNVPLSFSASLSFGAGMARARPRGSVSQQGGGMGSTGQLIAPSLTGDGRLQRHTESGLFGSSQSSECWGSQQMLAAEGGERTLTGSTMNLMQATIAEQRVPIAAALNEYLHVWQKGGETEDRTTRVFGTVLVSFAASSVPLLTDTTTDVEQLQLSLLPEGEEGTEGGGGVGTAIKQVVPNGKLVSPVKHKEAESAAAAAPNRHDFVFDRAALADWLLQQREERPQAAFFNAEVLRYELVEGSRITGEPPLVFTAYWKTTMMKEEEGVEEFSKSNPTGRSHVDLRINYRLNDACPLLQSGEAAAAAALTAIHFSTKLAGPAVVGNVVSEPQAEWDATACTLNWRLGELSLGTGGTAGGSLKARVYLGEGSGPPPPAPTNVQFTVSDRSLSRATLVLSPASDTYHLSMLRRKVLAGKYFCEPQVRM